MPLTQEQFDYARFLALLEHFDNTNAGESGNAIRRALKQCSDADLSFVDAVRLTFKTDDDLEQEYRDKMDAAAETINTQASTIENHEHEIERLRETLAARHEDKTNEDYSGGYIAQRWSRALLWIMTAAISCAWLWSALGHYLPSAIQAAVSIRPGTGALCIAVVFLVWCIAEYKANGWRVLKIKWSLWAVGWIALVFIIRALDHAYAPSGFAWLTDYYHAALLDPWAWWTTVLTPSGHQLTATLAALLMLAGIVAANLTEPNTGVLRFMRKVIS